MVGQVSLIRSDAAVPLSAVVLSDVLSAYPVIGRGANQLAPQRVTMAMATARQCGIDPQAAMRAMVER